jgi:integrase
VAAKMVKTRTPGIYKRGSRYVVVYRVNGRQKKESCRTLDEARKVKAARQADIARGEFHEASRLKFKAYASQWIRRYRGRGSGFRESTRQDYERNLERWVYPFFHDRLGRTVSAITPRDVSNFIGWLCEQKGPGGQPLSDSTVRNIVNPLRACLRTAVQEGLIRTNPTHGAVLPHRPSVEEMELDEVRALTREQLSTFLKIVHPRHRLMFEFLATTGLRVSEIFALQWRHLALDGANPHVKVRRAIVRGVVQPPKTKHGRRDVPLGPALAHALRERRRQTEWPDADDLVFPSQAGTALQQSNVLRRVLAPVAEEIGAPWAGFHTFRHTCASLLFNRGANAKQVQRWLGHHSAAFTLATYVHLLTDDLGEPLDLRAELPTMPAIDAVVPHVDTSAA